MKKLYISPAIEIVTIKLRDGILTNASQVGGDSTYTPGGGSSDWYNGEEEGGGGLNPGGGSADNDDDLSRTGNGGNVWDNIW